MSTDNFVDARRNLLDGHTDLLNYLSGMLDEHENTGCDLETFNITVDASTLGIIECFLALTMYMISLPSPKKIKELGTEELRLYNSTMLGAMVTPQRMLAAFKEVVRTGSTSMTSKVSEVRELSAAGALSEVANLCVSMGDTDMTMLKGVKSTLDGLADKHNKKEGVDTDTQKDILKNLMNNLKSGGTSH